MKRTLCLLFCIAALTAVSDAKWVFVMDGVVRETFAAKPDFHKDIMPMIFEAPANVEQNWRRVNNTWLPPKSEQEYANEAFDAKRTELKAKSGAQARRIMADTFRHKLNGDLNSGYPDPAQPICTNAAGQALTLSEFMDYMQECDDAGATQQEMQALRQQAKSARLYLKSLKGD